MSDPVGSFIWYELMTPNSDAAARFYGGILGWSIGKPVDTNPGGGDYRMIGRTDGGFAGGVLQLTPHMLTEGAHPTWLGYLYVEDRDAAVQAIVADGGQVLMQTDLSVGRIALVTDPLGTPFYVMTPVPPADNPAARSDVFDPMAPQRVRWNELASPNLERAKAFYAKHFGFEFKETMSMGPLGDYCFISHGGVPMIGAIMQKPEQAPSLGWLFYFGVESVAAAQKSIVTGGGAIVREPHEVPGGEWVLVATDPHGAAFGVVGRKGD
jgi:predicted enzyme related to lactoylglutathione lyase